MIQMEGEKQCAKCCECKPVMQFSIARKRDGSERRHSYCKDCRNQQARDRHLLGRVKRTDRPSRKPPRVEIWPRPLGELVIDSRVRTWRGPVNRGQLVPAIGVR